MGRRGRAENSAASIQRPSTLLLTLPCRCCASTCLSLCRATLDGGRVLASFHGLSDVRSDNGTSVAQAKKKKKHNNGRADAGALTAYSRNPAQAPQGQDDKNYEVAVGAANGRRRSASIGTLQDSTFGLTQQQCSHHAPCVAVRMHASVRACFRSRDLRVVRGSRGRRGVVGAPSGLRDLGRARQRTRDRLRSVIWANGSEAAEMVVVACRMVATSSCHNRQMPGAQRRDGDRARRKKDGLALNTRECSLKGGS